MVKNTFGGSGHKKFARKHNSSNSSNNKLRPSLDKDEIYSVVTKMLGNNMFHCVGIDSVTRLCRIRGKFAGRGKRDNMVCLGGWVLIGRREWVNTDDSKIIAKMEECDLLEVYSDAHKALLMDSVREDWTILLNNDTTKIISSHKQDDYDIVFDTADKMIERTQLLQDINSETIAKMNLNTSNNDDNEEEEDINIEDI